MQKEILAKIDSTIEELIGDSGGVIPVPVEQIAESMGIRIKRAPSDEFSGILLRKDGKALIGINSSESTVRQRFSIAHELGHYFLHPSKDVFVDYRDNKSGVIRNSKERSANMFAAALLIPKKAITEDVKRLAKEGIFEIEIADLAKKYEVSKEAMNYRLLNLGLAV